MDKLDMFDLKFLIGIDFFLYKVYFASKLIESSLTSFCSECDNH